MLSEEEIINKAKLIINNHREIDKMMVIEMVELVQGLLDLYNKEKDKINLKIEEYEEILQSSIIKEDYKLEVEHIIRVLKELKGDN